MNLVSDNYKWSTNELYSSWTDSDLRNYLIHNGWIKSDYEAKRDDLIALVQKHGNAVTDSARDYYAWSDARIRGYLRQTGLSLDRTPSTREGLLREMRARFQPQKGIFDQLKDGIRHVVESVQDAAGNAEAKAKVASVSASSASSAASVAASKAAAHQEL